MVDGRSLGAASILNIQADLSARSSKDPAHEAVVPERPLKEVATPQLVGAVRAKQKVIYGVDDRKDFYEFPDEEVANLSMSVAALFFAADLRDNGDDTSSLSTQHFGTKMNLCASERFREQPAGTFCSGFLVAPDIIGTAGHCVDTRNVADVRFVFGFRMAAADKPITRIPNGDIFCGSELIGQVEQSNGPDWALVRLDRAAVDRHVLGIRRSGRIADGTAVSVIGHPAGLPIKFAGGAAVRDNTPNTFFIANLDTYGGNSGSPVIGPDNIVEGVLVRGEVDFTPSGNCVVSNACPTTGCRGEDCTRAMEFAHLVPEASPPA